MEMFEHMNQTLQFVEKALSPVELMKCGGPPAPQPTPKRKASREELIREREEINGKLARLIVRRAKLTNRIERLEKRRDRIKARLAVL